MSRASMLLAELRGAGILIETQEGRLIIEAPPGVVTSELRRELASHKAELISELKMNRASRQQDSQATDALHAIASLMATAYRRYTAAQSVPVDHPCNGEVALSAEQSVHGVVP